MLVGLAFAACGSDERSASSIGSGGADASLGGAAGAGHSGVSGVGGIGGLDASAGAGGVIDPKATVLTIDFSPMSAQYPPTVAKIGFNSFWNSTTNDGKLDEFTIERSARYRAPMISGLIEPKVPIQVSATYPDLFEEWAGSVPAEKLDAQGCALWDQGTNYSGTLFQKKNGVVEARKPTDPDLASIRAFANTHGMLNFLQIAGTPGNALPFSSNMFNGFFTLVGEPPKGANWYPLPAAGQYPELAQAFATLPDAVGYETRTIYAFWQEPSHTLDSSVEAEQSIPRYTDLYSRISRRIAETCRWESCPMAGAQLNSHDGKLTPVNGQRYKLFLDGLRLARKNNPGVPMPLDYFTIQNYSAQWNDTIIGNARAALGTDFGWTPIMMNEWDYCVNGDECPEVFPFLKRYDGPQSWQALHWLKDSIEAPDISHVLLREKVLKVRDKEQGPTGYFYPWTQVPILFMASMSEFRRPVASALPKVPVMASGDPDQITILMWNESTEPKKFTFDLRNIPSALVGNTLYVKAMSSAIRDSACPGKQDVMNEDHEITCWKDVVTPLPISAADVQVSSFEVLPGEAVMLFAGEPPAYGSELFSKYFVRSYQLAERDGSAAPPEGMGHFDPQTGSITVGVKGMGTGLARAVLRNVPDTLTFRTRLARNGPLASTAIAGVRVDFFDDTHNLVKTVFHRDQRFGVSDAAWGKYGWPMASVSAADTANLCGTTCTDGSGTDVVLNLATEAPATWASSRLVEVGVLLTGAGTNAIYRVDFP